MFSVPIIGSASLSRRPDQDVPELVLVRESQLDIRSRALDRAEKLFLAFFLTIDTYDVTLHLLLFAEEYVNEKLNLKLF